MVDLSPLEFSSSMTYSPITTGTDSGRTLYVNTDNSWEIRFEDLELESEIGRGAFGVRISIS